MRVCNNSTPVPFLFHNSVHKVNQSVYKTKVFAKIPTGCIRMGKVKKRVKKFTFLYFRLLGTVLTSVYLRKVRACHIKRNYLIKRNLTVSRDGFQGLGRWRNPSTEIVTNWLSFTYAKIRCAYLRLHSCICYCIICAYTCKLSQYTKKGKTDRGVWRQILGKQCRLLWGHDSK